MTEPTKEGYWWAIWKSKAAGTTDPDDPPGPIPEIVYVMVNCFNKDENEHLGVFVGGVDKMQWLENFEWLRPVTDQYKERAK